MFLTSHTLHPKGNHSSDLSVTVFFFLLGFELCITGSHHVSHVCKRGWQTSVKSTDFGVWLISSTFRGIHPPSVCSYRQFTVTTVRDSLL